MVQVLEKMEHLSATQARLKLFSLIDKAAETHKPIYIKGKRNKAVLINEDDWRAMEETVYLLSIPGMRESIIEGINAPDEEMLSEEEFYAKLDEEGDED